MTNISTSFGMYMFCRHKHKKTTKYAFQVTYLSKTNTKSHSTLQLGQDNGVGAL
jgi:hypothetical protein